jgi:putative tryptophan/tyrosine transport system substrate-binding protein
MLLPWQGAADALNRLRRREFMTLLGGAAAWPIAARGQPGGRTRHIGALMPFKEQDAKGQEIVAALRQGLSDHGWTEGRNLEMKFRWVGDDIQRRSAYAAEIVAASPDVIFACYAAQLAPLARETGTIPIVFVGVSDPIGSGYVASFPRPGGNITGFTFYESSMAGKWLELLKTMVPNIKTVALMVNPETAILRGTFYLEALKTAAAKLSVESRTANVRNTGEIEVAIAELGQQPGGLIVAPETFTEVHREFIVALAARHRVPAIYGTGQAPEKSGGLISYGPNTTDTSRRAASYLDRILRGERPAELPIQAPTKFDLIVNLTTAKALGIDVPPTLLVRADEVIE